MGSTRLETTSWGVIHGSAVNVMPLSTIMEPKRPFFRPAPGEIIGRTDWLPPLRDGHAVRYVLDRHIGQQALDAAFAAVAAVLDAAERRLRRGRL